MECCWNQSLVPRGIHTHIYICMYIYLFYLSLSYQYLLYIYIYPSLTWYEHIYTYFYVYIRISLYTSLKRYHTNTVRHQSQLSQWRPLSMLESLRTGCVDHSSKCMRWFQKLTISLRPQSPSNDFAIWVRGVIKYNWTKVMDPTSTNQGSFIFKFSPKQMFKGSLASPGQGLRAPPHARSHAAGSMESRPPRLVGSLAPQKKVHWVWEQKRFHVCSPPQPSFDLIWSTTAPKAVT